LARICVPAALLDCPASSFADFRALNYADLAAGRDRLLNLKPPAYFGEFLANRSLLE
jgi:hypothetical protein